MNKTCLILERSGQNLRKIGDSKKTVLEGIFAVFDGKENRNGRIYEESMYLPHLQYLKDDIKSGALLGELDHPERFEVKLENVSHKILELWYDPSARQVKGRIEILENTPKGSIAKALLDAGIPLSISSRAAGTVLEDHRVQIQQIYTYDLVAKPGFAEAQLYSVSESDKSRIMNLASSLNESYNSLESKSISKKLGFNDEKLSIIELNESDISDFRPEARSILENFNSEYINKKDNNMNISEQQIVEMSERIKLLETQLADATAAQNDIQSIKSYIEQLRVIQESSINWQKDIAKAVNKVAGKYEALDEKCKSNEKMSLKISEAVDYNADVINNMEQWTGALAKSLNESIETIDNIEQWVGDSNHKANKLCEWTSSIATNLNSSIAYTENMLGRAVSKEDAKKLVAYIESIKEGKVTDKDKEIIMESLNSDSISSKLNENDATNLKTKMDSTKTIKVTDDTKKVKPVSGVYFDEKTKTIVARLSRSGFSKGTKPKELKTLDGDTKTDAPKMSSTEQLSVKGVKTMDKTTNIKIKKDEDKKSPKGFKKDQNLKTDTNKETSIKESFDKTKTISDRSNSLDEKLAAIAESLEKDRALKESVKNAYPFTQMLSESDRAKFYNLSESDKNLISESVEQANARDYNSVMRIWENCSTARVSNEPLWLSAAPAKYRELYNNAPDAVKESIQAKSAFYNLNTSYQIENFWETSGLVESKSFIINNDVIAANINPSLIAESVTDTYINDVGNYIKNRYNN